MSKLKNKKMFIPIIIVFVLIALGILTFLLNKNDTKKLKGQAVEEPANTAFKDNEFYWCVLNAYNNENGTNYNINYSLSDEQLTSIKNLKCSTVDIYDHYYSYGNQYGYSYYPIPEDEIVYQRKINSSIFYYDEFVEQEAYSFGDGNDNSIDDLSGIEKLTGLTYLELSYNMQKDVDLSNNKNLETLKLHWFKNVNLTNNTKLKDVVLFRGESVTGLKEIKDVKHLTFATMFENEDNIAFYDELAYLTSLESLELYSTMFNNFNTIKELNKITKLAIGSKYGVSFNERLNELPYLENLTSLTWNGLYDETGELPTLPNLTHLNITQSSRSAGMGTPAKSLADKLDYGKFPSLTHLYLGIEVDSSIKTLSDLTNFDTLVNLEYLDVRGVFDELDTIDNFKKLKTLIVDDVTSISGVCESVENVYGDLDDYASVPNIKVLADVYDMRNSKNTEILANLEEFYTHDTDYVYIGPLFQIEKFPNMRVFVHDSIEYTYHPDIRRMPNIETYIACGMDLIDSSQAIDLSKLKKLRYLFTASLVKGVENLTELEVLIVGAYDGSGKMTNDYDALFNIENYNKNIVNLSNNKKLNTLILFENFSKKIDVSGCDNLQYVEIDSSTEDLSLTNIDFSNNRNLKILKLRDNKLKSIDLSKNNKLIYFESENNYFDDKSSMALLLDSKFSKNNLNVILPDSYVIKNITGTSNLLTNKNGSFVAENLGSDEISVVYENVAPIAFTNLAPWDNKSREYVLKRDLMVLDVNSKEKTEINKQKGYILTNSLIKEKDIIKDIKISPKGMENTIYSVIDENKFKIYNFRNEITSFDLIKVVSDKYLVDNDNIYYNGNFNADNVEVSNATTSLNENKLDIIYNNEVIKTYNLIKKDNLLGDVNGDGKVSITDMTMQYKHVKYILDLEGDAEYRADLNSDEDVSITDVTSLYKLIKGNAGE